MINWKRCALELARIVSRHRKDRLHKDMLQGWDLAKEVIELGKKEKKAKEKYLEWWKCEDKKEAIILFDEYLELVKECY